LTFFKKNILGLDFPN